MNTGSSDVHIPYKKGNFHIYKVMFIPCCHYQLRWFSLNLNSVGIVVLKYIFIKKDAYLATEKCHIQPSMCTCSYQSELPWPIPQTSVESDLGCTLRIYFDNVGDNVMLTLYNVMLTSQKPC